MEITAFLSHKYNATTTNLFFFKILEECGIITHFNVDPKKIDFCVTRIEDMINQADAFIGIYPIPTEDIVLKKKELAEKSKYFLLEYRIALNNNKPILIIHDERFNSTFPSSRSTYSISYNNDEINSSATPPSRPSYEETIKRFKKEVQLYKELNQYIKNRNNSIGIVISPLSENSQSAQEAIVETFEDYGYITKALPSKNGLDTLTTTQIKKSSILAITVDNDPISKTIATYCHATGKPTIKLLKKDSCRDHLKLIYNDIETGYKKDIVEWRKNEDLTIETEKRINLIRHKKTRISNSTEATKYFTSSNLIDKKVFVSYTSVDSKAAKTIINTIKENYKEVFDYQDTNAIRVGDYWMDAIFNFIETSDIAIVLISKNYIQSDHCKKELLRITERHARKEIILIPLKLDETEVPSYIKDIQYKKPYKEENTERFVKRILSDFYD